ncbi:nitroreductase/quinone reductase family protein [Allostreptomyces psammosilenae]|uniref:Deazaflavin-dependent oxidoreductase (Nitroreductase family) n=1 Tax=Allostreptomyces psammosilenae TaxID=1892865 RepID=A0A853ACH7_9ACTN|nr:nitroreductase/quinone reductase family protein [Allostreptomyces psammosilenae]NYI08251.1 deazaflavin-dependent oxidoreductase (nitroreductase family) [Allostreptomyces psammosilenae]
MTSSITNSTPSTHPAPAQPREDFNRPIIEEFRANHGRVGGPFEGGDLLLLTTFGARSGAPHTVPLGYVADGDRLLVVGSAGGSPRHPAWYHNVLANPAVTVEVGDRTYPARAVPAHGEERDRLFALVVAAVPGYADYQARTARTIPVVALHAADPAEEPPRARAMADQFLEIHDWLREELARLREQVAAPPAGAAGGTPARLGVELRRHCLTFCDALRVHHTGEDVGAFPELERRHPELGPALARLREEHAVLARLLAELQALLDDDPSSGDGSRGDGPARRADRDPDRLRADLERLASELDAHFAYEEEHLLPALRDIPAVPLPPPAP